MLYSFQYGGEEKSGTKTFAPVIARNHYFWNHCRDVKDQVAVGSELNGNLTLSESFPVVNSSFITVTINGKLKSSPLIRLQKMIQIK